jgi:hypothetical protein
VGDWTGCSACCVSRHAAGCSALGRRAAEQRANRGKSRANRGKPRRRLRCYSVPYVVSRRITVRQQLRVCRAVLKRTRQVLAARFHASSAHSHFTGLINDELPQCHPQNPPFFNSAAHASTLHPESPDWNRHKTPQSSTAEISYMPNLPRSDNRHTNVASSFISSSRNITEQNPSPSHPVQCILCASHTCQDHKMQNLSPLYSPIPLFRSCPRLDSDYRTAVPYPLCPMSTQRHPYHSRNPSYQSTHLPLRLMISSHINTSALASSNPMHRNPCLGKE